MKERRDGVSLLLKRGALVDLVNDSGRTALMEAALSGPPGQRQAPSPSRRRSQPPRTQHLHRSGSRRDDDAQQLGAPF
jgi:hypothetical protein